MVNSYLLVNPYIEGSFQSKVKARNSNEAAKMLYTNLSEYFNNSVPAFYFSIQKGGKKDGKLYHFKVNEERNGDVVDFSIKSVNIVDEQSANNNFKNRLDEFKTKLKQSGGKHHKKDDSSESSSSSSEVYVKKSRPTIVEPLYYWWYDPYVYRLDSVFIPTFYSTTIPFYLEIKTTP